MTRTEPDPVLADAVRAELERRARRVSLPTAPRPGQPGRRDLMQLVVAAAVGVLILGVALGLGHLWTRPAAAPAPTARPTEVVEPDRHPSPSPTPSMSPTGAAAAPLIAPQGSQKRSDAELRAWATTLPANEAVDEAGWIEQQILIVHCMAGEGFLFDPEYRYSHGSDVPPPGHEQAYAEALSGPASDGLYDWRTAGCTGLAVHETGQDDAN